MVYQLNSSEAKASRVIIYKFPVKLPFPVHTVVGSREPRSPDTCIPMVSGTAGIPTSAHVSIRIRSIRIRSVRILFSAFSDDDCIRQ